MSIIKRVARNSVYLSASNLVTKIINFVFIIFIARYMGSEDFGKFSFIMAVVLTLSVFSNFGLDVIVVREAGHSEEEKDLYFSNAVFIKSVFSAIAFILVLVSVIASGNKWDSVKTYSLLIFSASIIFSSISQTIWSFADAHEEMQYHSLLSIVWSLLRNAVGLAVVLAGYKLIALFAGFLFAEVLSTALSYAVIRRRWKIKIFKPDFVFMKKIFSSALPIAISGIFVMIYYKIDTIMLSFMKGDAVVGWYNAAYNLINALSLVPAACATAVLPLASKLYKNSAFSGQLNDLHGKVYKYLFLIGLPIGVGTTVLAEKIIFVFYGGEYSNAVIALQILIWSLVIIFVNALLGSMLVATNQEKKLTVIVGIGTVINIVLNLLLIPVISYKGAAIVTVLTELSAFVLCSFALKKTGISFPLHKFYQPFVACLVMGAAIYKYRYSSIIVTIPVGIIVYFIMLFVMKTFRKEDLELLKDGV